jgi:hypothetical protein
MELLQLHFRRKMNIAGHRKAPHAPRSWRILYSEARPKIRVSV